MTDDKSSNSSKDDTIATVVARIVRCPQCRKSTEYSPRNPDRPFCSERCRTSDLGAWAEGKYAVPAEPSEMTEEEANLLSETLGEDQNIPPEE
ncbi:MAG: DNA gyrase inhibitor YacG [Deltaproteobacteria bacterium]|nr:DNA gyrase inhibitor YacG [Deltaproteobacteria bacterium]